MSPLQWYSDSVLWGLGFAGVVVALYRIVTLVWRYAAYQTDWTKWGSKDKQSWAVVTGATDGIGKEFALQLAAKGYSIVLIARDDAKLKATAEEVAALGPRAETYQLDFGTATIQDYESLKTFLGGKSVRVLLNNVGMSYKFPQYLEEPSADFIKTLTEVNITSAVSMVRVCAPAMLEAYKQSKKRSIIINVGSFSHYGAPLLGHYAGSKAYLHALSKSLLADYKPLGIDVRVLHPAMIATKLASIRTGSLLFPSPKKYVSSALRVVGDHTSFGQGGYWLHDVLCFFVDHVLPTALVQNRIHAFHKMKRAQALKKLAERKAQ